MKKRNFIVIEVREEDGEAGKGYTVAGTLRKNIMELIKRDGIDAAHMIFKEGEGKDFYGFDNLWPQVRDVMDEVKRRCGGTTGQSDYTSLHYQILAHAKSKRNVSLDWLQMFVTPDRSLADIVGVMWDLVEDGIFDYTANAVFVHRLSE